MPSVTINAPKTPVTKGSNGVAAATVPNVCKMPGPPAPFIPTPLPNIGMSGNDAQGYSKDVKIEGQPVAIQGASFGSQGDIASKGTGGGLISSNTHGPTKFIGPGSMDVTIEGKNVQLLGDPMLNNCGPGGSPANAATMMGLLQAPLPADYGRDVLKCPACEKSFDEHPHVKNSPNAVELVSLLHKEVRAQVESAAARRQPLVQRAAEIEGELAVYDAANERLTDEIKKTTDRELRKTLGAKLKEIGTTARGLRIELKAVNTQLNQLPSSRPYFMIGTMLCGATGCPTTRVFTAMSAKEEGAFAEASSELGGTKGLAWVHVKRGDLTRDEFTRRNPSPAAAKAWDETAARANDKVEGFQPPGQCAAMKLLAVSGHNPSDMSEMLYAVKRTGVDRKQVKVVVTAAKNKFLRWLQLALVEEQVPRMMLILKPKLRGFGDGQTVPSCNSCRALLPILLCEPASCSGSNAH